MFLSPYPLDNSYLTDCGTTTEGMNLILPWRSCLSAIVPESKTWRANGKAGRWGRDAAVVVPAPTKAFEGGLQRGQTGWVILVKCRHPHESGGPGFEQTKAAHGRLFYQGSPE